MKRSVVLVLVLALLAFSVTVSGQQNLGAVGKDVRENRFVVTTLEDDGFLGLRLGNSFRFAEEKLGDPSVVRNGSIEWHFSSADFEPFEALTVLGEKRKINGFIAHLKANRVQFSDLNVVPKPNKVGTFYGAKEYVVGKYQISVLLVGDDATYCRRITMVSKEKK